MSEPLDLEAIEESDAELRKRFDFARSNASITDVALLIAEVRRLREAGERVRQAWSAFAEAEAADAKGAGSKAESLALLVASQDAYDRLWAAVEGLK